MLLGAGRKKKEDPIDPAAGITLISKMGDKVSKGDIICQLRTNLDEIDDAMEKVKGAFVIKDEKPKTNPFIYNIIR